MRNVGLGALSLIPFLGILPGLAKISTRTRRLKRAIDVLTGPLRRLYSGLAEAVGRIGRGARPSNIRDATGELREELKRPAARLPSVLDTGGELLIAEASRFRPAVLVRNASSKRV